VVMLLIGFRPSAHPTAQYLVTLVQSNANSHIIPKWMDVDQGRRLRFASGGIIMASLKKLFAHGG
jgi:hypothetical protein